MSVLARVTLGLAACAAAAGCAPLRPIDDALDVLPRGELLWIDGRRVHVETRGKGEPLVLVHGFGASTYSWRKVLPDLAQRYRVVALDLNGFGLTEREPRRERYTRDGQVRLILGVMDRLGIDTAHFVGHSYGGALTMALVYEHPERARSMILVDSAPPQYPTARRKLFAAVRPLNWAYVRGLALTEPFIRRALRRSFHDDALVTPELVEGYLARLRVEGAVKAFRGLTAPNRDDRAAPRVPYEALDVPTLVIWGAQDRVVSPEKGFEHASRLPRFEWVTIDEAGHAPMEEQPEAFLSVLRTFLDRHTAERGR